MVVCAQGLEVAVNFIDRRVAALGWREAEKVYVGRLSWETDGDEIRLMPRMFWKISMLTVPAYVGGVYIGTMFSHWSHPRSICFLLVLYYAGCICSTKLKLLLYNTSFWFVQNHCNARTNALFFLTTCIILETTRRQKRH